MRSPFRLVLLALLGSGCQLVFGLNEYEASGGAEPSVGGSLVGAGGAGASQAGAPAGAGGEGASGAEPSSGGAPSIWTEVDLPDVGASAGPIPDVCASGGPRVTLFGGNIQAACVPCTGTPMEDSCRANLSCSTGNACTSNPSIIPVGFSCSDIGAFNYCGASAQSEASCTLTGGQVAPGDTSFDRFASFCPSAGAESSCSIATGNLGASACASIGRPFAYVLLNSADVSAECSVCSANPSSARSASLGSALLNSESSRPRCLADSGVAGTSLVPAGRLTVSPARSSTSARSS